jgi:hypothetical protein
LEADGGLESIWSFIKDEKFFSKNIKSFMKTFGKNKERVSKLLIANLSTLSQVDDLFTKKSQELNLIEFMFGIIENSETSSDLAFTANLFLLKNCNADQIETNGFDAVFVKKNKYLELCAKDFKNESKENLDKNRESRDLKIGNESLKYNFYAIDIDNSGIRTTLNVILDSLSLLASKNTKINFKSIIYNKFKIYLYTILEKGNTGEKRLVLDIYKYLAYDAAVGQDMKENMKQVKKSIMESSDYEGKLEVTYNNILYILGENYEKKQSEGRDSGFEKTTKSSNYILLCFNLENEQRCLMLKKRLEDQDYVVETKDIDGIFLSTEIFALNNALNMIIAELF